MTAIPATSGPTRLLLVPGPVPAKAPSRSCSSCSSSPQQPSRGPRATTTAFSTPRLRCRPIMPSLCTPLACSSSIVIRKLSTPLPRRLRNSPAHFKQRLLFYTLKPLYVVLPTLARGPRLALGRFSLCDLLVHPRRDSVLLGAPHLPDPTAALFTVILLLNSTALELGRWTSPKLMAICAAVVRPCAIVEFEKPFLRQSPSASLRLHAPSSSSCWAAGILPQTFRRAHPRRRSTFRLCACSFRSNNRPPLKIGSALRALWTHIVSELSLD